MMKENRKIRLEKAIKHLMSLGLIDKNAASKSIAEKMNRGIHSVCSAINGDERYFTLKFTKAFCSTFQNIVSDTWIWNGEGEMLTNKEENTTKSFFLNDEKLKALSNEELITLVKQLIILHNEQTEMYRLLIIQNQEMIRNGQERLNNITNLILKNV